MTNNVGATFVPHETTKTFQLPALAIFFTPELNAILRVLCHIESKNTKSTLILSDSLSTLVAM